MKLKRIFAGTMVATLIMSQSIFAGTTLTVNGDYVQKTAPDCATINFDISAVAETAKLSKEAATQSLSSLVDKLTASNLGVKKENIKVIYQSTWEKYDYVTVEPTEEEKAEALEYDYYIGPYENYDVVGFETTYTVQIEVSDFSNSDKVYDIILSDSENVGYTNVNYSLKNSDDAYYTALEKAVEVALEKADKLSKTFFNGKKYTVQSIAETGYNYSYSDYYGGMITGGSKIDINEFLPQVQTNGSVSITVEFED